MPKSEKPEQTVVIELSHSIEFNGVVYQKGRNITVPRALAILQGAIDADPAPDVTQIAPETVQSQVQSSVMELVTRIQESERNAFVLQSKLDAVSIERDQVSQSLVATQAAREAAEVENTRLQEENKALAARIAVLAAAVPKTESSSIANPEQPAN